MSEDNNSHPVTVGSKWKAKKGRNAGKVVECVHIDEDNNATLRDPTNGKDSSLHLDDFGGRYEPVTEATFVERVEEERNPDTNDAEELKRRLALHQKYRAKQVELVEARRTKKEEVQEAKDTLTLKRKELVALEEQIANLIEEGPCKQESLFSSEYSDDSDDSDEDSEGGEY